MPEDDFPESPISPAITFRSSLWHDTLNYLSSGWPVAYLISAVSIGVWLFIASCFYTSYPQAVVNNTNTHPSSTVPRPSVVARVTGMVNCEFSDPSTTTFTGAYTSLGRKYALASGLMEITYDSGAKVILQGPCDYAVTASAAGYLSLGKLTARIENKKKKLRKGGHLESKSFAAGR